MVFGGGGAVHTAGGAGDGLTAGFGDGGATVLAVGGAGVCCLFGNLTTDLCDAVVVEGLGAVVCAVDYIAECGHILVR